MLTGPPQAEADTLVLLPVFCASPGFAPAGSSPAAEIQAWAVGWVEASFPKVGRSPQVCPVLGHVKSCRGEIHTTISCGLWESWE